MTFVFIIVKKVIMTNRGKCCMQSRVRFVISPPPPPRQLLPVIPGFRFPGLGLPVPRESLLARTISMGWYWYIHYQRGESRWGVRVDLPPSLYRGMAIVQSSVNSEPIPHAPPHWVHGSPRLELAWKSWPLHEFWSVDRLFVFFTPHSVSLQAWTQGESYMRTKQLTGVTATTKRTLISYKTAVQYFNMLGCRHFKQRKIVFFYSRQICNILLIDDPACYMYCVYSMQHASSWHSINTI
jgi:hypothetical protein